MTVSLAFGFILAIVIGSAPSMSASKEKIVPQSVVDRYSKSVCPIGSTQMTTIELTHTIPSFSINPSGVIYISNFDTPSKFGWTLIYSKSKLTTSIRSCIPTIFALNVPGKLDQVSAGNIDAMPTGGLVIYLNRVSGIDSDVLEGLASKAITIAIPNRATEAMINKTVSANVELISSINVDSTFMSYLSFIQNKTKSITYDGHLYVFSPFDEGSLLNLNDTANRNRPLVSLAVLTLSTGTDICSRSKKPALTLQYALNTATPVKDRPSYTEHGISYGKQYGTTETEELSGNCSHIGSCIRISVGGSVKVITMDHINAWEKKHGAIPRNSIVFFHTGFAGHHWYIDYYKSDENPTISAEVLQYLLSRSVSTVGIDSFTLTSESSNFNFNQITNLDSYKLARMSEKGSSCMLISLPFGTLSVPVDPLSKPVSMSSPIAIVVFDTAINGSECSNKSNNTWSIILIVLIVAAIELNYL